MSSSLEPEFVINHSFCRAWPQISRNETQYTTFYYLVLLCDVYMKMTDYPGSIPSNSKTQNLYVIPNSIGFIKHWTIITATVTLLGMWGEFFDYPSIFQTSLIAFRVTERVEPIPTAIEQM